MRVAGLLTVRSRQVMEALELSLEGEREAVEEPEALLPSLAREAGEVLELEEEVLARLTTLFRDSLLGVWEDLEAVVVDYRVFPLMEAAREGESMVL